MARSLDQILREVSPSYAGSEKLIKNQQATLQPAAEAEVSGLRAQLDVANESILSDARSRGLGFSGIPVGEQAKYAATQFAPAVARVKQNQIERQTTLSEALNQIGRDKMGTAQGLYQQDLSRDEQMRQFNAQMKFQREQMAAQERAARSAASAGAGAYLGGGGGLMPTVGPQQGGGNNAIKTKAMSQVNEMLSRRNTRSFFEEIQAIAKSAGYGNQVDQAKLELLRVRQPGLFQKGQLNTNRVNQLWNMYQG